MNQITTQYVTEGGACYEQYVITDPAAKTALTITPERGGMITGFTLDGASTSGPAAPTSASATAPGSVCRCSSPAAATRTAASICSTAKPTPWSATASPTCAPGSGERRPRRCDADPGVHPADQVPLPV